MSFTMGAYSYSEPTFRGNHNNVTIGKYCSIASGVIIDCGFSHNIHNVSTYPFNPNVEGCGHLPLNLKIKGDVIIGNDVYIGENCIIMSGVTIGDGAVIGINTVVTRNVAPYEVVAGTKRWFRFTSERVEELMNIKWWDWSDERVKENVHLLLSEDIQKFIDEHI